MWGLKKLLLVVPVLFFGLPGNTQSVVYTMPEETALHEGTWLQWPHNHLYGPFYRDDLDPTWIAMTRELVGGEKVHIIAYDQTEQNHITNVLTNAGVSLANVDFYQHPNDDCWVRDNGPIFVFDDSNNLHITDWGFNGWGNSTPYAQCDLIPGLVGQDISIPVVDVNAMVLEGGAIEIDGNGSMLATRSSIVNSNRNPGLTEQDIEGYLTTNLGITNFIWLDGVAGLDITDMHIDGFARFLDTSTIVCMDSADLVYWDVPSADIGTLLNAQNAHGNTFNYVYLPLTVNDVVTTWNENLGIKGSYVNYYVGNDVVLVPHYNDPNDAVADGIIQGMYPNRTVAGIDVRNLYYGGGMVHCVTQQQPLATPVNIADSDANTADEIVLQHSPNPVIGSTIIRFELESGDQATLEIYNAVGQLVETLSTQNQANGNHALVLDCTSYPAGIYTTVLTTAKGKRADSRFVVSK